MKINPILNPNILNSYQAVKPVSGVKKVVGKSDEVTFSEEALNFSKALADARSALGVRTPEERAHIADVTNAVRNGQYSVSSDKIADKILESVLKK